MARKSSGLGPWLATLSCTSMLELLRARPDAGVAPEPGNPTELAARLSTTRSVQRALALLTRPALQVAEALLALGGQAPREELASLLGVGTDAEHTRFDAALGELSRLALVWPVAGELRVVGSARELIHQPLALGSPARSLLEQLTVAQLSRIGSALGLGGITLKTGWVQAVAGALSDPDAVTTRLAVAHPALVEAIERIAWHGPRVSGVRLPRAHEQVPSHAVGAQLAVQGWVVAGEWGEIGEMPCEVALAVRGPDYRAPLDPAPPAPATAAVDPGRVQDASRHAAGAAVDLMRRMLAAVDRTPLDTLQAGGVGVRELRRLAKVLGTDEADVRLWLELAAAAGLVGTSGVEVVLTKVADGWVDSDPGDALAGLLSTWWSLEVLPGHRVDDTGKALPALGWAYLPRGVTQLRQDLLAELPAEGAVGLADPSDVTPLVQRLAHRRPILHSHPDVLVPRLRATLAEATRLGLVADGALTELGVALLAAAGADDMAGAIAEVTAGLLPAPATTATFLPDLTVVVGGTVSAGLSTLLDETADAESRDTASTWRFSPASVRRALDGGRDAESLLGALAEVAENRLPQPLEYLVRDAARRHGELEVVPAACCVLVADAGLAAEIAAHRKLAPLRLRLLGGPVLASALPANQTIMALRAAGYAPIQRDAAGQTVINRAPMRRAKPRGPTPTQAAATIIGREQADLPALARRLTGS